MKKQKCKRCQKTKPVQAFVRQSENRGRDKDAGDICMDCREKEDQARKEQVFRIVLEKAEKLGLTGTGNR